MGGTDTPISRAWACTRESTMRQTPAAVQEFLSNEMHREHCGLRPGFPRLKFHKDCSFATNNYLNDPKHFFFQLLKQSACCCKCLSNANRLRIFFSYETVKRRQRGTVQPSEDLKGERALPRKRATSPQCDTKPLQGWEESSPAALPKETPIAPSLSHPSSPPQVSTHR